MKSSTNLFILALIAIAGCSGGSTSAPNFFNGHYYMAGDKSCVRIYQIAEGRVMCHDKAGHATGYRDAMTGQQLQMYMHNQQIRRMEMQRFAMELQQTAQSFQQSAQMYQQIPQYSAPPVANFHRPGAQQVRCISAGIYTNCRY